MDSEIGDIEEKSEILCSNNDNSNSLEIEENAEVPQSQVQIQSDFALIEARKVNEIPETRGNQSKKFEERIDCNEPNNDYTQYYLILVSALLTEFEKLNPWWAIHYNNYFFHMWNVTFSYSKRKNKVTFYYLMDIFRFDPDFLEKCVDNVKIVSHDHQERPLKHNVAMHPDLNEHLTHLWPSKSNDIEHSKANGERKKKISQINKTNLEQIVPNDDELKLQDRNPKEVHQDGKVEELEKYYGSNIEIESSDQPHDNSEYRLKLSGSSNIQNHEENQVTADLGIKSDMASCNISTNNSNFKLLHESLGLKKESVLNEKRNGSFPYNCILEYTKNLSILSILEIYRSLDKYRERIDAGFTPLSHDDT